MNVQVHSSKAWGMFGAGKVVTAPHPTPTHVLVVAEALHFPLASMKLSTPVWPVECCKKVQVTFWACFLASHKSQITANCDWQIRLTLHPVSKDEDNIAKLCWLFIFNCDFSYSLALWLLKHLREEQSGIANPINMRLLHCKEPPECRRCKCEATDVLNPHLA